MVVFFDIDGTLVDDATQVIPRSTIEAVEALAAGGHIPVINTGRPYTHIDPRVRAMAFRGYVCGCGMEIRYDDRWLARRTPEQEVCSLVVQQARRYGVLPMFEATDGTACYDPALLGHPTQLRELENARKRGFPVCSIDEHPNFSKFASWCPREDDALAFRRAVEPYFDYIPRGSEGFSEFTLKGCSKAAGMLELLETLGISRSETLAIGDSTNDMPMFQTAAHTVCMGNGLPEVKQAVQYITASVLEDGIARALRHFGLIE